MPGTIPVFYSPKLSIWLHRKGYFLAFPVEIQAGFHGIPVFRFAGVGQDIIFPIARFKPFRRTFFHFGLIDAISGPTRLGDLRKPGPEFRRLSH